MTSTPFSSATLPDAGTVVDWNNLSGVSKILSITNSISGAPHSVLILTDSNDDAQRVVSEMSFFCNDSESIILLPDTETLPYDLEQPPSELTSSRAAVFHKLTNNPTERMVIVTTVKAAMRRIASKDHWMSHLKLKVSDAVDTNELLVKLSELGYQEATTVLSRGQYSIRGRIIDISPFGSDSSARIIVGEAGHISEIRKLSLSKQLSSEQLDHVMVLSCRELPTTISTRTEFSKNWRAKFGSFRGIDIFESVVNDHVYPGGIESYLPFFTATTTLFDIIPNNYKTVFFEGAEEAASKYEATTIARYEEVSSFRKGFVLEPTELWITKDALLTQCKKNGFIRVNSGVSGIDFETEKTTFERAESVEATIDMLTPWVGKAEKVIYCMSSDSRREEMDLICEMLDQSADWASSWEETQTEGSSSFIALANIEKGFYAPSEGILVITEKEIFGQPIFQKNDSSDTINFEYNKFKDFQTLTIGSPLVHLKYGVGRYNGLVSMDYFDVKREYLTIRYAEDALIYVKMEDLDFVSRYSGIDQEKAPLDIVGSERWLKGLTEGFTEIKNVAHRLLQIYSEKEVKIGISMGETDHRYEKFCSEFPFQETDDQLQATNEIISDLQSKKPMDRIVCGDVGFGKTEVAMRAAFHAVSSGYQVALMVPSTILANQHFESFIQRFTSFPYKIECMTRFAKKSEERSVLKSLVSGGVDILIGTHRIIQSDVRYRNLGLLIVDEEHRFGVKQKEALREMRSDMNLLSMTATPIPRTLSMSMHGIRDLSTITTPPAKRLSIRTFVENISDALIKEAITRETMRSGQVFYVHNKIDTIEETADNIRALFPELTVVVAHAKMSEIELEKIMADFYSKNSDVLVCTTIIETGIDVPNANTIIIEKANNFGLAQLHQLRGRVGRSNKQAYAYLTHESSKLSEYAEKRLKAMAEASSLGEGYMLANHDMEIRGAGEILGEKQSGQIQAIGFQLYMRLLERAIDILKSGKEIDGDFKDELHVNVDVNISNLIPENYVTDQATRLSFYKRVASAVGSTEIKGINDELRDRFGPIPDMLVNHILISSIKHGLAKKGISKISASESGGYIEYDPGNITTSDKFNSLAINQPGTYALKNGNLLTFSAQTHGLAERISTIESIVA